MKKMTEFGVTQKIMAILSGVNMSSVNRYIASNEIKPLPDSRKRNFRFSINDTRKVLNEFIASRNMVSDDKKVQAFYNFKGGTGKTSLCFQAATHLSLSGYNVLVIDADPQAHLSTTLGFACDENLYTIYDGIVSGITPNKIIKNVFPGLDCVPSNLSLTRIETKLNESVKREEQIGFYIESLKPKYDFIIFDSNPNISHLNRNILNACDMINIICETHPYSINGLSLLMDDISAFFNTMKIPVPEVMVVPNKYEDRASSSLEAMTALNQFWGKYLIPEFAVRRSEDFPKSARDQLPLALFCKANSIALEDVRDLMVEIINRSCVSGKEGLKGS